ncbi:AMP-binding protein [Granulibacter bethesdensis]|uniref:AMP-(Fatty)acid ligase n=1 Tax=Granulibacter bethesdensis (strain ATCC BAA-1260 / CGDNIH1) TaxID=391165 RepID=Q0BW67_GRABC|nr:AMP-binding protein [Granulibacter bethesdensis]ABI60935.1 AMP-(fatty)acid ligase [Granulibacter bethesdensis CGDNIH1]APH50700.1 AMP-(fatty)acid ligase [Granulibacter bethesdensis]APH63395.1 AMP-(fatty)acid ligase [Granulibacter bethesdensis]
MLTTHALSVTRRAPASTALTDRQPHETLFLTPDGAVPNGAITVAMFLGEADLLTRQLPACRFLALPSRNRLAVATGFAAAQIMGIPALMTAERTLHGLEHLIQSYPGTALLLSSSDTDLIDLARQQGWTFVIWDMSGASVWSRPPHDIPDDRIAAIAFTSGSTGNPVAHTKRWRALVERSRAIGTRFALPTETDAPCHIVAPVPSQHMYGFELSILLPLHTKAAIWCGPAFYPADITHALERIPAPRMLVCTPLHMRAMQDAALPAPPLLRTISATAPLSPPLASGFEARFGTEVHEIYGATEIGSFATRRTVAEDKWHLLDGVSLEAAGGSGAGQDGIEIDQPVAQAPFCPDTRLADIVALLPDRSFRLLGRQADMIKRGGKRASLAGLSHILSELPGVEDGTFYLPFHKADDANNPEAKLIALVVAPGCSVTTIMEGLRARIDPAFLPRRVVKVEALPRNALGKLPRNAIEDMLHRMNTIAF